MLSFWLSGFLFSSFWCNEVHASQKCSQIYGISLSNNWCKFSATPSEKLSQNIQTFVHLYTDKGVKVNGKPAWVLDDMDTALLESLPVNFPERKKWDLFYV